MYGGDDFRNALLELAKSTPKSDDAQSESDAERRESVNLMASLSQSVLCGGYDVDLTTRTRDGDTDSTLGTMRCCS